MIVHLGKDGTLTVPVRIQYASGAIGDATKRIGRDDPDYATWLPFVNAIDEQPGDALPSDAVPFRERNPKREAK